MSAYLEITLSIEAKNRSAAAEVYKKYRKPFLTQIQGAQTKRLLVREEDVQVLHGFETVADVQNYLKSSLFTEDVVVQLKPYLDGDPEIRVYDVAG